MYDIDLSGSHIPGFFKDVKYFATGDLDEKVAELLTLGGAKKTAYLSGSNTHCIAGDNPEYNDISEVSFCTNSVLMKSVILKTLVASKIIIYFFIW